MLVFGSGSIVIFSFFDSSDLACIYDGFFLVLDFIVVFFLVVGVGKDLDFCVGLDSLLELSVILAGVDIGGIWVVIGGGVFDDVFDVFIG